LEIHITDQYKAGLINAMDPTALNDCFISPDEIRSSPGAVILDEAFRQAMATQLSVDPSTIQITGIHTDGDQISGCSPCDVGFYLGSGMCNPCAVQT
jgi:hypothetical protein